MMRLKKRVDLIGELRSEIVLSHGSVLEFCNLDHLKDVLANSRNFSKCVAINYAQFAWKRSIFLRKVSKQECPGRKLDRCLSRIMLQGSTTAMNKSLCQRECERNNTFINARRADLKSCCLSREVLSRMLILILVRSPKEQSQRVYLK